MNQKIFVWKKEGYKAEHIIRGLYRFWESGKGRAFGFHNSYLSTLAKSKLLFTIKTPTASMDDTVGMNFILCGLWNGDLHIGDDIQYRQTEEPLLILQFQKADHPDIGAEYEWCILSWLSLHRIFRQ